MQEKLSNGNVEVINKRGFRARTALWFERDAAKKRAICAEFARLEAVMPLKTDIKKKLAKKYKITERTIENYIRLNN